MEKVTEKELATHVKHGTVIERPWPGIPVEEGEEQLMQYRWSTECGREMHRKSEALEKESTAESSEDCF